MINASTKTHVQANKMIEILTALAFRLESGNRSTYSVAGVPIYVQDSLYRSNIFYIYKWIYYNRLEKGRRGNITYVKLYVNSAGERVPKRWRKFECVRTKYMDRSTRGEKTVYWRLSLSINAQLDNIITYRFV